MLNVKIDSSNILVYATAQRTVTNRWFVSVEMPRQWRGEQIFARQIKSFPTEAEAKHFAKEIALQQNQDCGRHIA
jgi:hypothetical protein